MVDVPTGTVTLLFTDIEGSTKLLHELGDRYADVLAEHRRLLREAFQGHGGVEVDTQGDAFFYAFPSAKGALAAAAAGQQALQGSPIKVRIGVHTGEPIATDEGYVGLDVHRAARIMSAGHGGQVLVSESTQRLVGSQVDLCDLGPQRLKDLTAPERLFQLGDGDFPPLKTLNQTNLPVAASALVGRERELGELLALLRDGNRVVTITGPGGSGKTRLALQVAAEIVDDFVDGVFWVPLAGLDDPALVLPTIAQTLGVGVDLAGHLAQRQTLLLLDNFEHMLDAVPALAALLAEAPRVRVLGTSRAPLRLEGESEYPLEPLHEPDAITLFVERSAAAGRRVEPDSTVAAICRRLDSLPLALELAAARTKLLAPAALLERLDRRLPVLTGGRRDAPERQRTLRATIEWSHELLDDDAKRLFARLAVFSGDFSLEAAETVCDAELESLAALVDLSLLKPVGDDRFLMLETIGEYAAEELGASGEAEALRRRHAQYFLDVAESAHLAAETAEEQRPDIAIREQSQLRAALDWALAADPVLGLQIAAALEQFWHTNNPLEGWSRTSALLERVHDPALRARGLRVLGGVAIFSGDAAAARDLYRESLELYRSLGDAWGVSHLLMRLAHDAAQRGVPDEARDFAEQSLALSREHGFSRNEIHILDLQGQLELEAGNEERGVALMQESARRAAEIGFFWWEMVSLYGLALGLVERGRAVRATPYAQQALAAAERLDDRMRIVPSLALFARLAVQQGDAERAGRLWGALEAEVEREPVPGWTPKESIHAEAVLARSGTEEFERGRAVGAALTLEEALAGIRAASPAID
jgi:predicted ATPase/class 3 adenylate cyclase